MELLVVAWSIGQSVRMITFWLFEFIMFYWHGYILGEIY